MLDERILLDDGAIRIIDVRCGGGYAAGGGEEAVPVPEVIIPLSGVFVRTVRQAGSAAAPTESLADASQALIFRAREPYRVRHPVGGPDRSIVLALVDPGVELRAAGRAERPVPPHVSITARRLAAGLASGRLDGVAAAELAHALLQTIDVVGQTPSQVASPRDHRLALAVRLDVADRMAERRTLPELGRAFGLSGWELARRFRRATGTSIHAYRVRLRVNAALERVDAGERDLTALALDLGFADHSHLTNAVRRVAGAPPSAFRRPPSAAEAAAMRTILQA